MNWYQHWLDMIYFSATYEWHVIACGTSRKPLTKEEFRVWATTRPRISPFF
jgi:hypothetical protein